MIYTRRGFIRILDYYFDEPTVPMAADIVRYNQWSYRVPGNACTEFYTVLLDLCRSRDALLNAMKREARYEIRRAGREGLAYEYYSDPDLSTIDEFCGFYNTFAAERGLARAPRTRIVLVCESGCLRLSRVSLKGETLTWHAYLTSGSRARLTHSVSLYRNRTDAGERALIGRANRFHHWEDMVRFQTEGIRTYDLGGWYPGAEDPKLLQINKFKEEFGGRVVCCFNCTRGVTLRGRVVLSVRSLGWK